MVREIGLTGNVAAGKSSVAELFRGWGATIIDADAIVHELQAPGAPMLARIVERFGAGMLDPAGALDRARLRALVFADAGARSDLEAITHPAVLARREALVAEARLRGDRVVVSDIPLLFETMDPDAFDAVVLVDAPEPVRRARLVERRGLSPADAERLIAAQGPTAAKRARSDFIIDNDGDEAGLERQARAVWRAVTGA